MGRKLLAMLEWAGVAIAFVIMSALPHRLLLVLCDFCSAVLYRFDRRGRVRALQNLRIVTGRIPSKDDVVHFDPDVATYDPSPREACVIRRSYRNMSRTVGHLVWTSVYSRRRAAAVGEMSERGQSFLAANRPAITVSAHIGCWEILSQLAFLEGHRMMSVAKDIGTPALTKLLMRARRSIGQEIVPAAGALKVLMAGLRDGRSLGLLVDQRVDPEDGGLWIRFLGRPLPVSAAPAFFSAKTKAPIVTAWSRPLKDGRYRCEVINSYSAEDARDIWMMTQRCARDIERVVKRHPSCWVLNYNYFSNRPTEKDLAQLAKREGRVYEPRKPREICHHAMLGQEADIHYRAVRDLHARPDGWPVRITVFLPNEQQRDRVDLNYKYVEQLFADLSHKIVAGQVASSRVAVLVPAYNVERFLPQCLDSLLNQTCPVDVFCCDDGSADGTGRILDDYAARYPRIHAIHQSNRGMSATYNRLLDELPAEYEYVGIVDSDDYVHPAMFDSLLSAMLCSNADVSECGVASVAEGDVQPTGTSVDMCSKGYRLIDDMSVYWLRETAPSGWISKWNKLYRREAIGPIRFRIGLDYEDDFFFATEVNARIRRKVIVSDRFYGYRSNPNSLNGRVNFRKYISSVALRLRLSCETFLAAGRIPPQFVEGWKRDLVKDAYRMLVRKNLKKNPDRALRRELFLSAGAHLRQLSGDFDLQSDGLSIVQRLVYESCLKGQYALSSILVKLT